MYAEKNSLFNQKEAYWFDSSRDTITTQKTPLRQCLLPSVLSKTPCPYLIANPEPQPNHQLGQPDNVINLSRYL